MTRIKPAFYKRLCRRLEDYKFHAQAIRDAEKKILELSEEVDTGVDGIDYDKSIVLTSHASQAVEQIAISRAELEAYYDNAIRIHRDAHESMTKALNILDPDERKIVIAVHVDKKNWTQVQHLVNWSRRTCIRRRNEGMAKLALYLYGESARESNCC